MIVRCPESRPGTTNCAVFPVSGTLAPSCVPLSKKVTVPVGVLVAAGATVAVSVTACTGVTEVGFALSVVIEPCLATDTVKVAVAVALLVSVTVTV